MFALGLYLGGVCSVVLFVLNSMDEDGEGPEDLPLLFVVALLWPPVLGYVAWRRARRGRR